MILESGVCLGLWGDFIYWDGCIEGKRMLIVESKECPLGPFGTICSTHSRMHQDSLIKVIKHQLYPSYNPLPTYQSKKKSKISVFMLN